jgi:hypothetical protein
MDEDGLCMMVIPEGIQAIVKGLIHISFYPRPLKDP